MDIIEKAKIILGIDSEKDDLLKVLYAGTVEEFLDYTNRQDIPTGAESVLLNMLVVQYNRLGTQGLNSQSYSGVSEAYIDGYPQSIIKQLNRYRKLKMV